MMRCKQRKKFPNTNLLSIHIPSGSSVERLNKARLNEIPMNLDSKKINALNREANAHIKKICGRIRDAMQRSRVLV
jgi:hypothetical protein